MRAVEYHHDQTQCHICDSQYAVIYSKITLINLSYTFQKKVMELRDRVKLSLQQAVKAHRGVRSRGSHIF
jgi:hypothetical protein